MNRSHRIFDYAGPRTEAPRIYGPIPRRQVWLNFASLGLGAWLFFGLSPRDWLMGDLAQPLAVMLLVPQMLATFWPTWWFILRNELPLAWFDLGVLVVPMTLGLAATVGVLIR